MDGPAPGFALYGKSLRGIMVGSAAMFKALAAFIEGHEIKPIIARSFQLENAEDALHTQAASSAFGKLVIEFWLLLRPNLPIFEQHAKRQTISNECDRQSTHQILAQSRKMH